MYCQGLQTHFQQQHEMNKSLIPRQAPQAAVWVALEFFRDLSCGSVADGLFCLLCPPGYHLSLILRNLHIFIHLRIHFCVKLYWIMQTGVLHKKNVTYRSGLQLDCTKPQNMMLNIWLKVLIHLFRTKYILKKHNLIMEYQ